MSNKLSTPDSEGFYKCHWTGERVHSSEVKWLPPIIQQVRGVYASHPTLGQDARKESLKLFQEFEANCNTCSHLVRTHNDKLFQYGVCTKKKEKIRFCSGDCMGMECYEGRINKINIK